MMKIFTYKILLLFAISLSFYSCAKSLDDIQPTTETEASVLSFINAVPLESNLDIYLSGNKITNNNFAFGTRTDYGFTQPGNKTVEVAVQSSIDKLRTETFTLTANAYSLFVVNELEKVEFLLLEDDRTIPPPGKAKIRFVNLSPDEGSLDFSIIGQTTDVTVGNKAFKAFSPFILIDAPKTVAFQAKSNFGNGMLAGLVTDILPGKTYTVWAKGYKSYSGDIPLSLSIFEHK